MAWTAPRTWTTGELVTAAIMNTHIRDNQTYLKTYDPNTLMTTRGDMMRMGASAAERFAKGTVGQILEMGADDPAWAANDSIQKDGSVAFTADQPMGGFSLTGLAAGAAAGESVRYDELNKATHSDPSGALDTIYQAGANIEIIMFQTGGGAGTVAVYLGSGTPPTDLQYSLDSGDHDGCTLIVPPSWYYKFTDLVGTPDIGYWHKIVLHG